MIQFNNPEHGRRIRRELGMLPHPDDVTITRSGNSVQILGGLLYRNFTGSSIEMHVASFHDTWLCRDLLWVMFHYPFVQLGCVKALGLVPSKNVRCLAFARNLGFKDEARIRDVYPGDDMVVLEMRKEECRWLAIRPKGIGVGNEQTQ